MLKQRYFSKVNEEQYFHSFGQMFDIKIDGNNQRHLKICLCYNSIMKNPIHILQHPSEHKATLNRKVDAAV